MFFSAHCRVWLRISGYRWVKVRVLVEIMQCIGLGLFLMCSMWIVVIFGGFYVGFRNVMIFFGVLGLFFCIIYGVERCELSLGGFCWLIFLKLMENFGTLGFVGLLDGINELSRYPEVLGLCVCCGRSATNSLKTRNSQLYVLSEQGMLPFCGTVVCWVWFSFRITILF